MPKITFSYLIAYPKEDKLVTEKKKSSALLVARIVELHGEALEQATLGLLVQWARKAVAGEVIVIDKFLIVRILEKEAPQ